mgnify:CR=1 FL=1
MDKYSFLNAAHTAYFADLYDQYLDNPDSIEPSWKAFFQGYDFGSENYGFSKIMRSIQTLNIKLSKFATYQITKKIFLVI